MKCNPYIEKRCQSCQYLNLSYEDSIKEKESHFQRVFENIKIKNILPTMTNNKVEGSRNKAKLSVSLVDNQIAFGIYDQAQNFKNLMDCPLHLDGINQILVDLKKLFEEFKILPYQLSDKKGEIKSIIITKSDTTDEMMIRFVLRSKESLDRLKKLVIKLREKNEQIKVCSANIQPLHAAVLEGEEEIVLTVNESISHQYDDFKIKLGVRSFFQVNSEIARKLYSEARNLLADRGIKTLLDLYCGVGAFSFYLSKSVEQVLGVEISEKAIQYANETKLNHQVKNVEFQALDVDLFLSFNESKYDAILVNPPRRGVGKKSIEAILKLTPNYIVYSSCQAESLRSDFELLKNYYQIESIQIFDMFPFSKHYEVLVLMTRM